MIRKPVIDPSTGQGEFQVFDAFGNRIGGDTFLLGGRCAPPPWGLECDHDNAPDSLPGPQPVARRQSGMYNWRGGEGSATDLNLYDITEDADASGETYEPVTRPAYTENLTGLVYMQARYYEPETGRFTQADPVPYGMESFLSGQNNRWVYCGNDPINITDPTGQLGILAIVAIVILALIALAFLLWLILLFFDLGCWLGPTWANELALATILVGAIGGILCVFPGTAPIGIGLLILTCLLGIAWYASATAHPYVPYTYADAIYDWVLTKLDLNPGSEEEDRLNGIQMTLEVLAYA